MSPSLLSSLVRKCVLPAGLLLCQAGFAQGPGNAKNEHHQVQVNIAQLLQSNGVERTLEELRNNRYRQLGFEIVVMDRACKFLVQTVYPPNVGKTCSTISPNPSVPGGGSYWYPLAAQAFQNGQSSLNHPYWRAMWDTYCVAQGEMVICVATLGRAPGATGRK